MFRLPKMVLLAALPLGSATSYGEAPDFNRDIRPILSENCFHCHGPDAKAREADLRLDTFLGATTGGEFADPIVPGKPDESEVLVRIHSDDPDELWRTVIRRQPGRLSWLADAPDDLSSN